ELRNLRGAPRRTALVTRTRFSGRLFADREFVLPVAERRDPLLWQPRRTILAASDVRQPPRIDPRQTAMEQSPRLQRPDTRQCPRPAGRRVLQTATRARPRLCIAVLGAMKSDSGCQVLEDEPFIFGGEIGAHAHLPDHRSCRSR